MISFIKRLEPYFAIWIPYLFVGWMALATYLTLVPADLLTSAAKVGNPKVGHVILFGGWTLLFGLLLIIYFRRQNISVILIVAAGIAFGAFIEFLQYMMPFSRSGTLADIGFNTIGAVMAGGIIYMYKKTLHERALSDSHTSAPKDS